MPPHPDEGTSAAPGISPGVVEDGECLVREMIDPQHVKDGQILARAIPVADLRCRGFSVHRMKYVLRCFIRSAIDERIGRTKRDPPWTDAGVAVMKAGDIRGIRDGGKQAFKVIDTALPENPGHASIFAASPEKGNAHARKLRSLLTSLLQNRMPLEQAYETALRRRARDSAS